MAGSLRLPKGSRVAGLVNNPLKRPMKTGFVGKTGVIEALPCGELIRFGRRLAGQERRLRGQPPLRESGATAGPMTSYAT